MNYFSTYGIDSSHTYIHQSYEVPIQVGDQLSIVVSALNPQSAVPYNLPLGTKSITVEQDGRILYPQLGLITVEGLTISQLRDVLSARLKSYLTDPVVSIEFVNFKITVLGEVSSPGVKLVPDGKVNIIQALAQSGDLTMYAKRYPVMVIRENKGRREFGYVNLYSNSIFSSPYYRLQQNDIVYVQAREDKPSANEQTVNRRLTLATTIFGLVTTIGLLILNLTK
jgi:polysaccharide biosynthesis/export protein